MVNIVVTYPLLREFMFAIGHLAIGYLVGRGSQKLLQAGINIPAIFFLSLISDADLLLPGIAHRTATHSLIIQISVFIPAFLLYKKNSLPYFAAFVQHSLIGDSLTNGGAQIFWPFSKFSLGFGLIMQSSISTLVEWVGFLLTIAVMIRSGDMHILFTSHRSNLLLIVPAGAIFLSAIFGIGFMSPPAVLLFPHLLFLGIFAFSVLKFLQHPITPKQP